MMRLLIAAAAFTALAGAAAAQPAYSESQGAPPEKYPPCTHKGQDRCVQHGGKGHHHMAGHKHMGHKSSAKSSTDGERG